MFDSDPASVLAQENKVLKNTIARINKIMKQP